MNKYFCVVSNCKMRTWSITPEQSKLTANEYLVSFHKFPDDPKQQKLWTKALGNEDWVPNNDSVVCSLHFTGDSYDGNNKLRDTAIPSIVFDDFESHLKLILDAIEKEKCDEIDTFSSNRNQNLSSEEPKTSGEDETSAFSSSDSDFEIECEEILVSDGSDYDNDTKNIGVSSKSTENTTAATEPMTQLIQPSTPNLVSKSCTTCENIEKPATKVISSSVFKISSPLTKCSSLPSTSETSKPTTKPDDIISKSSKLTEDVTVVSKSNMPTKESTAAFKEDVSSTRAESTIPKLHNIPTKEDTSEQARQLYSMIQSGSFQNFPVMQPASKNLVRQLLDIVKLANARNQTSANGEESIPNTYIITTKYDDPNSTAKVKLVETAEVISMVSQTVQAIKDGTYEKSDDLVIICGSPAIFLIKNVSVKSFDPNMNSVYVITTENLISYLYLLSTQVKSQRKIPVKTPQTDTVQVSSATSGKPPTAAIASKLPSVTLQKPGWITVPKNKTVSLSSIISKFTPQVPTITSAQSSKNASLTPTPRPVVPTSSSQAHLHLKSIAPALESHSASLPTPMSLENVSTSSVGGENTPSRLPLSVAKIPANNTPLLIAAKPFLSTNAANTSQLSSLDSIVSSPNTSSNLLVTQSSGTAPLVVIPSKGSAFQIPKQVTAPLTVMRNNMMKAIQRMDGIHESKKSPSKSVPSLVLTQLPSSSNTIILPPNVTSTLNKTGLVKLTFAPPLVSTPITTQQPFKQTTQLAKKTPVCSIDAKETNSSVQTKTTPLKRKATDFLFVSSTPKRVAIGSGDNANCSNFIPPAISRSDLQKSSAPAKAASPAPPSPVAENNVESGSEEERPLSPLATQRFLAKQRSQIHTLEQNIIQTERDILALRKKLPALKKRCLAVKKTVDSKSDEQLVEDILKKYLDNDAVQFFVGQMKVSGKTFTQFRWTEEDKLFALGLLYKNPIEYNMLLQRFTLPSDKTLNKFVSRIKRAEMDANAKS